ncbi:alpha/beta-hydrolase [Meira miltonrushii]|uniref:Prolyl endopeptidase n=1 Tax=Meira miltonrushii TaxID=1280837 RepID=A0A316VBT7_9BASI|nr:alpha/beta-hydrolase [Meira miltonrushii]PWN34996.1 alpha/beta-hydrolase [Meira miltonrushii]
MRFIVPFLAFALILESVILAVHPKGRKSLPTSLPAYPKVHRVDKTWSYRSAKAKGNVTYSDPYFWLEGSKNDKDIKKFIADQTNTTETYIQGWKGKNTTVQALKDANYYDKYGPRWNRWDRLVYCFDSEFQAARKENFKNPPGKQFLNETLLSADGSASVLYVNASPDGKVFCYLVITAGDVGTWYFRNFDSPLVHAKTFPDGGEGRLKDTLTVSADQLFWTPDSKAIFSPKTVETDEGTNPTLGYKMRYHVWGTEESKDIIIFDFKKAGDLGEYSFCYTYFSPDGKWLIISLFLDSEYNMMTYATRLTGQKISENMKWISLSPSYNFSMFAGGVIDDTYYFLTNKDSKNRKIAKVHLDWSKARNVHNFTELQDQPEVFDVIAERKDALINFDGFRITNRDKGLVNYIENGQNTLYSYELKTGELIQRLLQNEQLSYTDDRGDQNSNIMIMSFDSWNSPIKIFEFKWMNGQLDTSTVLTGHIKGSSPDDFTIEEFYATSKDGAKIPYFLTYRKNIRRTGSNPTLVNVYGSYGDVYSLYYRPDYFDFIRSYDGYMVWAGVRGGGDKGGSWHEAAQGLKKQKTFDDTIAILEDLVKRKITSPGNLILEGNSAGGLAVGAVANQAPEGLLGAAFLVRGICDVFQLELRSTIGMGNADEFGDVTTPEGFDSVFAWSPLQNINPKKQYPAILVTPGLFDEQTPPSGCFKFVAQMQYDHPKNKKPLLMYVNPTGAHLSVTITELSYQFCILEETLGIRRTKDE